MCPNRSLELAIAWPCLLGCVTPARGAEQPAPFPGASRPMALPSLLTFSPCAEQRTVKHVCCPSRMMHSPIAHSSVK
eukprot:scaffold2543_cov30-Tisochrysis_lutea.AAC.1